VCNQVIINTFISLLIFLPHDMSELEQQAIRNYGADVVSTVIQMVEICDPDGVWSTFQDMGMLEHAECVEFLYFGETE
jgi:hypothetical protein